MSNRVTLKILKDLWCLKLGSVSGVMVPAGTVLESVGIVNNGTPFLAYLCNYNGSAIYVKPIIGWVLTT